MLRNERLVPPDTLQVGCEPYFKTLAFSLLTSLNAVVNRSIKASNLTHRANGTDHFASCFAPFATKSKFLLSMEVSLEMFKWLQQELQAPLSVAIAGMKLRVILNRFHMQKSFYSCITGFQRIFQTELLWFVNKGYPFYLHPSFENSQSIKTCWHKQEFNPSQMKNRLLQGVVSDKNVPPQKEGWNFRYNYLLKTE